MNTEINIKKKKGIRNISDYKGVKIKMQGCWDGIYQLQRKRGACKENCRSM